MVETARIEGKKLTELFQQLIYSKTIISMHVVGTDFERLTCIVSVQDGPDAKAIVVDSPNDIRQALSKVGTWRLRFVFIGPERVEHVFETVGGEHVAEGLRLPFPFYVERLQRRKNFRMIMPPGSHMLVTTDLIKAFVDLLNVSLGGAFGALRKHNLKGVNGPVLRLGEHIEKAGIFFPADSVIKEQVVVIQRAVVRRVEKDPEKKIFKYGFEFLEVELEQQKKLTQYLYHLQRLFLLRR
jgi:hypothetical protein